MVWRQLKHQLPQYKAGESRMRFGLLKIGVGAVALVLVSGCVGMRQYNVAQHEYLREVRDKTSGATADLCVIEFDDEGEIWDRRQLVDTLALIDRRNAESPGGIVLSRFGGASRTGSA